MFASQPIEERRLQVQGERERMGIEEVRTADGVRIWLEWCGAKWWKLHIDTGDYERIIDLNDTERLALAGVLRRAQDIGPAPTQGASA